MHCAAAYSPGYYAHYGPNVSSETVYALLADRIDRDDRVLELGCSAGRHLAYLLEHGFERLAGIELHRDAFDVLEESYPDLAEIIEFYPHAIEDVIRDIPDDRFSGSYSVETLQHVHPDADWIFDELTRVTRDVVVTMENERETAGLSADDYHVTYVDDDIPVYHRNWEAIFTARGFTPLEVTVTDRHIVRTFGAKSSR